MIKDLESNSKGYGFIEFSNNSEFLSAFRQGSGKWLRGKPINVDAEYARVTRGFRPMRLGGGLGQTRRSKGLRFKRYFLF